VDNIIDHKKYLIEFDKSLTTVYQLVLTLYVVGKIKFSKNAMTYVTWFEFIRKAEAISILFSLRRIHNKKMIFICPHSGNYTLTSSH